MLRIGSLELDLPAVQAALSGYSDLPMRSVARAHSAPFCLNEVVLDKDVVAQGKLRQRILDIPEEDHPVGGQLMGSQPEGFAPAARDLVRAGYDLVDINFGCPVPKVLGRCRGGFLLGDAELALGIIDRVMQACAGEVPVTVKMRRGIDLGPDAERQFFAILEGAYELGVAAITLHGRTVVQRYKGPSDWSFLRKVKAHVGDKVLLGSGDLFSPYDIERMLAETGVDGASVARGCIGNPWIFSQYRQLRAGRRPEAPNIAAQRQAILMHWQAARDWCGAERARGKMRTHGIKYAAVHPEPIAVRDAFVGMRKAGDLERILEEWYPQSRWQESSSILREGGFDVQSLKSCGVAGGRVG